MIKQPILIELQYFVDSVALLYKGAPLKDHSKLVKCSLNLLEDLPSARDAVLEYFSLIFANSVRKYIIHVENGSQNEQVNDDDFIQEISDTLEKLIATGPAAWSPIISAWSLKLLGELSEKGSYDKNNRRRTLDIRTACNLWLGSAAIRSLIGLTALCFSKLNEEETDICINGLLQTFAVYAPHFNWVMARLGGCFPLKIILRILKCGLKRFTGDDSRDKLDSEIEILSYLSCSHGGDLKFALKDIIRVELSNNLLIPFFLYLSRVSDVLAQAIATVFLEIYDDRILMTIKAKSRLWPISYNPKNLLHLVTDLLLKVKNSTVKIVLLLAKVAEDHFWCQELLENLFIELETFQYHTRPTSFLDDIIKDAHKDLLWKACSSEKVLEQQTAVRIILLTSLKSSFFYHDTIAELLTSSSVGTSHLNGLIRILGGAYGVPEIPKPDAGIEIALEKLALSANRVKDGRSAVNVSNIIQNLVDIVKIEKSSSTPHLKTVSVAQVLQEHLAKLLVIWKSLLNNQKSVIEEPRQSVTSNKSEVAKKLKNEYQNYFDIVQPNEFFEREQIHALAKLIDLIDINGRSTILTMSETMELATLSVRYFFFCLHLPNTSNLSENVSRCYSLLSKQCNSKKSARAAALREILEGALFTYSNLFGSQAEFDACDDRPDELLINLNQKQGIAMNAYRSTVLHAGIIGQGLRLPKPNAERPILGVEGEAQNRLLNAIAACCIDTSDHQNTVDGFSFVSLMLVELVSTDVMYNGLPWPEEEFSKVTMERDLQIRRTFNTAPILLSILGLVANYRPALCYSSVLLRALCASVLHQWRSKAGDNIYSIQADLKLITVKLLELLAIGQLLPPPLDHLHLLIEYFDANEIVLLLKDSVWNYMKEHVPSPILFSHDQTTGIHWRNPLLSRPAAQFTDPLRNMMQKRITKLGNLYHQLFVVPELNNVTTAAGVDGTNSTPVVTVTID